MKQEELLQRMADCCVDRGAGSPPFTLILGSGFSYGIIPTTSQIVQKDLSWWKWCQRADDGGPTRQDFLNLNESRDDEEAKAEAKAFWARVHKAQSSTSPKKFGLGPDGLPTRETLAEAYRFALSPACGPGLNTPRDVRRYFGDIIRRAGRRLNPAHLYLASIIGDAKTRKLFGTIFTTNFDPLLQRSLQLVNAPYFVSDRPETLQYPDDDDVADAVHVIHAHGSIYRYLLLNTPETIEEYAAANQNKLQEYFRKHAVLIVGFSGWDDAITRALENVAQFDLNLYWCDRNADPGKSGLTSAALGVLKKHTNAFYVPIKDADDLMVQMHQRLVNHALPRIFREPVLSARDQLNLCDLNGVRLRRVVDALSTPSTDGKADGSMSPSSLADDLDLDLGTELGIVRKRLEAAQDVFVGETSAANADFLLRALVRHRASVASDLHSGGQHIEAIDHLDFVLHSAHVLEPHERSLAYFRRGFAYGTRDQAGDAELAIADFTSVIEMLDVPDDHRATALFNRGIAYGKRGQPADNLLKIADLTAVIEMRSTRAEQRARARVVRGASLHESDQPGDADLAIDDFTAVIEQMPDAPVDARVNARIGRGFAYGRRGKIGDADLAIGDFTAVIEMPDAPATKRASALTVRGVAYGKRGQKGDADLEISDYTAIIEMPGQLAERRSRAMLMRGVAYGRRGQVGDPELEMSDLTAVIEMLGAPAELRARALMKRAATYDERGQTSDLALKIADYSAVIEMSDAPPERRARALLNRAICYEKRAQGGDVGLKIADYTAIIEMHEVSTQLRASALLGRADAYGERGEAGDVALMIADDTAVIDMPDAPAEQRALALMTRANVYATRGEMGDVALQIADCTAVIEMPDVPAEERAMALLTRGDAYAKRGKAGDDALKIADYTAVIEMPDTPADLQTLAQSALNGN